MVEACRSRAVLAGLCRAIASEGDLLKLMDDTFEYDCSFRAPLIRLFWCLDAVGRRMERGSERAAPLRSILAAVEQKLGLLGRNVNHRDSFLRFYFDVQKYLNGLIGRRIE